jgi:hypothetical protein
MFKKAILGIVSLAGVLAITVAVGCSDGPAVTPGEDLGMTTKPDLTSNGPPADMTVVSDCVKNPTTHLEIINACTDSPAAPDKTPEFPALAPGGVLPSLP